MRDLGLRGPGDDLLQLRPLLLGELLDRVEGDHALGQALVHEGDVVLQDAANLGAPFRPACRCVEAVERRLHAAAIGQHRAAPGLVAGLSIYGPTTSASTIVLWPTDFSS